MPLQSLLLQNLLWECFQLYPSKQAVLDTTEQLSLTETSILFDYFILILPQHFSNNEVLYLKLYTPTYRKNCDDIHLFQ